MQNKKIYFLLVLSIVGFLMLVVSREAYKRGMSAGQKIGFIEGKEDAISQFILLTK